MKAKCQMNKERWTQFASVENFKLQQRRKIEKNSFLFKIIIKSLKRKSFIIYSFHETFLPVT